MFNFFKNQKDVDLKDEVIMEILLMVAQVAENAVRPEKEKKITNETVLLAAIPMAKLGELKKLHEYLRSSDSHIINMTGAKLVEVSRHYRELISKKKEDDNGK
jgi:hypothetical protein